MDVLSTIKQLVLRGDVLFTTKAREEMQAEWITELEVREAILNARRIDKALRSSNPLTGERERLYVIKSFTFAHRLLYTKGKIVSEPDARGFAHDKFYIFISSKEAF